MKTNKKILNKNFLIMAVAFTLLIVLIATSVSLAYIKKNKEVASSSSEIGTTEIVSISNPTINNPINFSAGATVACPININLSANVDSVVRVKVATSFYDENGVQKVLPNYLTLNLDQTHGTWTSDEYGLCFYLNNNAKDLSTLNFISSITFNNDSYAENYVGTQLKLVVEAEILQQKSIDYTNHPWKDNAPSSWLTQAENNFN